MNKMVASLTAAFLLTFSSGVLAEENHPHNHGNGHNITVDTTSSHEMPGMTSEQHQNMQSEGGLHSGAHEITANEGHGEGHEMGEEIVETPPNWGVLSTFGAINLAFILIGIWNKWFKKKEAN